MKMLNNWPDGFRSQMKVPATSSVSRWMFRIKFNRPIFNFDVPNGDKVKQNTTFNGVKNRLYNGRDMRGQTLSLVTTLRHTSHPDPIQYNT